MEERHQPCCLEWFVGASWYGYTWGESVVSKNITEKTGVNVTITTPTDDVSTELSLYMVSGDLPDIITLATGRAAILHCMSRVMSMR